MSTDKPKNPVRRVKKSLKDKEGKFEFAYVLHYFSDWDRDTKHMTPAQEGFYGRLRSIYFDNAGEDKNNGYITDDFDLLCLRVVAKSKDERSDVAFLLRDKFKKIGKSYRHQAWDKYIKNARFNGGKVGNADTKSNADSNAPCNTDGNASNAPCNVTNDESHYHEVTDYVMTGAERTEKSRKLKSLKNKGVHADKSMTLDEIRGLYDTHFNPCNAGSNTTNNTPCNADSNEVCNASNAQNAENKPLNHYPLSITQELQEKNECVNSETLHAPTHTNFSQKLKTIGEWQAPSVDIINGLLSESGFGRTLSQDEYGQIFTKFKNYNVSRELQGNFLATEQVRMDKLVDWIKREKPIFNAPTPADDDFGGVWTNDSNNKLPEPKPNTFNVGGKWVECFDGYNGMECIAIIKEYRLTGETSLEAYERIKRAGVANCQKPQTASPEFVSHILSKYNRPQQVKQVAR